MQARRERWVIGAGLLLVLAACEEPAPPPEREAPPRPFEPPADLVPPPPSAWPARVEPLGDALERFTTVEACLAGLRASTPTALSEGIADLGYEAFFADVCASMQAVRAGDADGCEALSVSSARRGCRRRIALFHGSPEACPDDPVTPGREAVCVAWAARDPDLCRAASPADRARCEAVLAGDARRCAGAREGDVARCGAEVARYGAALGTQRRASPAAAAEATFAVEVDGASVREREVERGVRLVPRRCRTHITLAAPLGPAAIGRAEPSVSLEIVVPARLAPPARLPLGASEAVLTVTTPARGTLASAGGAEGHVELTAYEPRLGGAIAGTIEGRLGTQRDAPRVRGRFATFVRDLDPLDDGCR
ncbi:MAG: hypothetical protein KF729_11090 [Sandaracinaceae bacterium]|nr:hypothetical protein [Sandaracinaceae bacterium]